MQNCSYPEKKLLTDRGATVPPIVKTVYLLRTKSCARFTLSGEKFELENLSTSFAGEFEADSG